MYRFFSRTFLILLSTLGLDATWANECDELLSLLQTRNTTDKQLNYHDDASYVEFNLKAQSNGIMEEFFDSEFDTRIYHANTALPNLNTGVIPKVDPNARGLFVFIHGSGTMSATGRNFNALMNSINAYGFAGLSFDLPYHADGPINENFHDPDYFMNWIKGIIEKYRQPGVPVYLIGHSYGAEVIPEFMSRQPNVVQGGLSVSLVGFTKELKNWYEQRTSNMDFGVYTNHAADQWADNVAAKFTWNTKGAKLVNHRVLTGDREEYIPGPIDERTKFPSGPNTYHYKDALLSILPDSEVVIEAGVGHYIFDHLDKNGRNAMMREILNTAGLDPSLLDKKEVPINVSLFPNTDTAMQKYSRDPLFRAWVILNYKSKRAFFNMLRKSNEKVSQRILLTYEAHRKEREARLKL